MEKKTKLSDQVRDILRKYSPTGEPVAIADLALELDMVFAKDKHPLYWTLKAMRKTGEVERIKPGVVAYRGRKAAPNSLDAMWSVLRMRRSVTIADLQELTGAAKSYAREFMGMLARRGCVQSIQRKDHTRVYRLIRDIGPQTPKDTHKADRRRAARQAKKRAIEQLDAAGKSLLDATQAIARARMAVNDLSEEAGHDE